MEVLALESSIYAEETYKNLIDSVKSKLSEFRRYSMEVDEKEDYNLVKRNLLKLGEDKLLGIFVPESYGGRGLDFRAFSFFTEELSRHCTSTAFSYIAHILSISSILFGGSEEQKRELLPVMSREKIGAFALAEPQAGSDVSSIRTNAVKKGGKYIINGEKRFITNAYISDYLILFAKTDPERGNKGISAFIIDSKRQGVKISEPQPKMGMRGAPVSQISFKDVEASEEELIGKENEGFKIAMKSLDIGRIGASSISLGISKRALEVSLSFAKSRVQFNQPIADFEGIQFKLADMYAKMKAAEALTYHVSYMLDRGRAEPSDIATAKLFSSEAVNYIVSEALQIFGGFGYIRGAEVERLYRDARILSIGEGTSEIQKIIIARKLLRE
ncbi:MAG: acyl-CoA dehydrogenase [Fervidicoccus fontis]|nr:MAG: acyl-CoA dehydrogenase [Fervidicoccus fontis]